MDPIKFDDFFKADNSKIIGAFDEIIKTYKDLSGVIVSESKEIEKALTSINTNTKKGQQEAIQYNSDVKMLTDQMKVYQKQIASLEAQNKKLQEAQKQKNDLDKASIQLNNQRSRETLKLAKAQEKEAAQLEKTNQRLKEESELLLRDAKSIAELAKQTSLLAKQRRELDKSLNPKKFAALTAQISKNNIELKKFDAQIGNYQRNVGNYASATKSFFSGILAAGGFAGVTMLLVDSVNVIKDFEVQMSKLRAITGATDEVMLKLSNDAQRLGGATKFTAKEVGELQVEFAKFGFSTTEILNATEATLNLAAATGEGLSKSATVAAATLRGFGLDASEMGRVTDVMAKGFTSSALDLDKFKESMKYVAPIAKAAGVSIEQTTALLGTLADAGISGSQAGTSLRRILSDLAKTGKPFDEAFTDMTKSGLSVKDAFDEVGRTAQTALLVLSDGAVKTNTLTESLNKANGAAKTMADTMQDNLAGDITLALSAWDALILSLNKGEGTITKVSRGIVGFGTGIIKYLQGINDGILNIDGSLNTSGLIKSIQSNGATIKALTEKELTQLSNTRERLNKAMFESQDKQEREYLVSQIKAIDKKVANDKLMRSREAKEKQTAIDKANKLALSEEQKINDLLASEEEKARKLRQKANEQRINDEFKARQLRIGAMSDGIDKDIVTLKLGFDKEKIEWLNLGLDTEILVMHNLEKIQEIRDKYAAEALAKTQKQAAQDLVVKKEAFNKEIEAFDLEQELKRAEFAAVKSSEAEKTAFTLKQQIERYEKQIQLAEQFAGLVPETEIAIIKQELANAKAELSGGDDGGFSIYKLIGFKGGKEDQQELKGLLNTALSEVQRFYEARAQAEVDAINKVVSARDKDVESAQSVYENERDLRDKGLANNYESAERNLQIAKDAQEKALIEQEKAQKKQQQIQAISQAVSLVTAVANIWSTSTSLGPYGWILAAVATAAMFGSFLSSKTKAKEATQYSEGGYLEIGGGSHASGNDTTFAVVNGREHKAERGEAHAIFTGRATSKYGSLIPNMVDATNALQLENMISIPSEATRTLDYTGILKSGVRATESLASAITRNREVISSSTYVDKRGRTISETRKNGIVTHTKIVE